METLADPAAAAAADGAQSKNFRFFDNRQKYLLFVTTCSEKETVARRVGMELAHIRPTPPAVRLFDAGMGDGSVLTRVLVATATGRTLPPRNCSIRFGTGVIMALTRPARRSINAGDVPL